MGFLLACCPLLLKSDPLVLLQFCSDVLEHLKACNAALCPAVRENNVHLIQSSSNPSSSNLSSYNLKACDAALCPAVREQCL